MLIVPTLAYCLVDENIIILLIPFLTAQLMLPTSSHQSHYETLLKAQITTQFLSFIAPQLVW